MVHKSGMHQLQTFALLLLSEALLAIPTGKFAVHEGWEEATVPLEQVQTHHQARRLQGPGTAHRSLQRLLGASLRTTASVLMHLIPAVSSWR